MPTLWPVISLSITVAALVLLLRGLRGVTDVGVRFLCIALWLRMASASFANVTAPSLIGPLSINAMLSLSIIGLGLLLLRGRELSLRGLWPVYLYIGLSTLSGLMNMHVAPLVETLLNWSYMLIVALLVSRAIRLYGCDHALRMVFPAFVMPVVLGLASFVVGYGKVAGPDASVSYMAGYVHESIYSVVVFTTLTVAMLIRWRWSAARFLFMGAALLAIILANYRTTVLALLPLLAVLGYATFQQIVPERYRPSALILGAMLGVMAVALVLANLPPRFADVGTVLSLKEIDLSNPLLLSDEERRLLSGRLLIWSRYFEDYLNADVVQHIIGFGPSAYSVLPQLTTHAHNNYILDLHSIGALGLIALLLVHGNIVVRAAGLADRHLAVNLLAAQLGFMTISLATSPLNIIEGLIFHGMVLGVALGAVQRTRQGAAAHGRFAQV